MRPAVIPTFALIVALTAACGGSPSTTRPAQGTSSGAAAAHLPRGGEPVQFDPSEFTAEIDNPYWPMTPGGRWIYRETDAEGSVRREVVTVTNETKTIIGIEAVVVRDVVSERGEVIEDTDDWYAQDAEGNIWYLGEETAEYENGKLKTREGSWEAGVDGAFAGIILPAHPKPGLTYREEYYEGHAEDSAEVLTLNAHAEARYGSFDHVLQIRTFTPLERSLVEEKFYARGVGVVLDLTVSGGSDRARLVSYTRG